MKDKITQEEWAEVLLEGWKRFWKLDFCILRAFEVPPDRKLSKEEWFELKNKLSGLKPRVDQYTFSGLDLRGWIASNATFANDALYQGRFEMAKSYFKLGGKRTKGRFKSKAEEKS